MPQETTRGVEGASWGPYRTYSYVYIDLPPDDVRARLPEDVIRAKHPEVLIAYDGKRTIEDPASRWFEATGKSAGRVKCDSPSADARCRQYAERYTAMKAAARTLIDQQGIGRHPAPPPLPR
jgi:hypothetical protein